MTLIIGFGNKARHGKDTAGEAVRDYYASLAKPFFKHGLTEYRKIDARIYKWADALYAEVNDWLVSDSGKAWIESSIDVNKSRLFIMPSDPVRIENIVHIPSWVVPEPNAKVTPQAPNGKHPKLLQWWGTEYRRTQDPDYWVKKLVARIKSESPDVALITDTRFVNEAQAVKDLGGYNLNVSRLNADGTPFIAPDRPANHPSETSLDNWNWDLKIVNSDGHAALTGELAITYVEYLRGLHNK